MANGGFDVTNRKLEKKYPVVRGPTHAGCGLTFCYTREPVSQETASEKGAILDATPHSIDPRVDG